MLGAVAGIFLLEAGRGRAWLWPAKALYVVRMFFVTAGYHRYFSHKSFRTSRAMQLVFAVGAQSSSQKGVLWWASHHRRHHKFSDQPGDVHSALRDGFLWSHVGWVLARDTQATETQRVRDLTDYPELVWLNDWWWTPPASARSRLVPRRRLVPASCGRSSMSTTLVWHGTFTINSLTHTFGSRRYATTDDSRNNALLALMTLGEGWHNNHHYYQRSVRQGFYWWEVDVSYYVLRLMALVGLVWDLHLPSERVRRGEKAGPTVVEAPGGVSTPGEPSPAE